MRINIWIVLGTLLLLLASAPSLSCWGSVLILLTMSRSSASAESAPGVVRSRGRYPKEAAVLEGPSLSQKFRGGARKRVTPRLQILQTHVHNLNIGISVDRFKLVWNH